MGRLNSAWVAIAIMCGACTAVPPDDPAVGSATSALTADQCVAFEQNGKTSICHRTGSASHPYTLVRVSEQACVNAHAGHEGDYVTSSDPGSPLYDPTCNGQGCLPAAAPCDATVPCCEGSVCLHGTCEAITVGACFLSLDQVADCQALGGEQVFDASCPDFDELRFLTCFPTCPDDLVAVPDPSCGGIFNGNACYAPTHVQGSRCVVPDCGNGVTEAPAERCDDGNHLDGDACSQCSCSDPDGGLDPFVGAFTEDDNGGSADFCISSGPNEGKLAEESCVDGKRAEPTIITCPAGTFCPTTSSPLFELPSRCRPIP